MKNLLYISLVDWYWIKQRPHHFCEQLSEYENISFFSRRPWKKNPNLVYSHSTTDNNLNKSKIILNKNLTVLRKRLVPKGEKFKFVNSLNNKLISLYLDFLDKKHKYDVIIFTHPLQCNYINYKLLRNKVIIYDCMDNYREFGGDNKEEILENEKKLVEISNFIIVSSDTLADNLESLYKNIKNKTHIINNGVDLDTFDKGNLKSVNNTNVLRKNSRKKVGYVGVIGAWLDLNLIKNIAAKYKEIEFYLIGPIELGKNIEAVSNIENIIITGTQPYFSIPNILNDLDVTIMPFMLNDLVKSVNPVKIYEYLSMGKPVIAIDYEETVKFGELIYRYNNQEEFEKQLLNALKEDESLIDMRLKFAKNNSWKARANMLKDIIGL